MKKESLTEFFEKHLNYMDLINNEKELVNSVEDENNTCLKNAISLSIVVMCRNEKRCIERCLLSIKGQLAIEDELLIIDTGSTDGTLSIIKTTTPQAKIFEEEWKNDFSNIRNIAIDKAQKDWIFFIDADEFLEENALRNLTQLLRVINVDKHPHIAVCPIIVNSNSHVVNGVKRIIRKDSDLRFYGYVHEELRYDRTLLGSDVESVSFDNVILFHDGYEQSIIEEKNKVDRNVFLLKKMIFLEPTHPRWKYFLSRDGSGCLDMTEYEVLLKETIKLCEKEKQKHYYDVRAISDLINFYIMKDEIELAEKYLVQLENTLPELSDVFYYKELLKYRRIKEETFVLLQEVCEYKKGRQEIEYGGIHANYFHIDFLIAKLFFEVGDYDATFNILKKLRECKFGIDDKVYRELLKKIKEYLKTRD